MTMRQLRISASVTNRESISISRYLNEIKKLPVLRPEEESALASLARKGDKKALEKLAKANLRFVVSVAKQYQGKGIPLDDLVNEGNMGLLEAAKRYDVTRGFKFISYAVWHIRQSILKAIAENASSIRVPVNKVQVRNRIRRRESVLEQILEREPSAEELADEMNLPVEEVTDCLSVKTAVSLDTPLSDEGDSSLVDIVADVNAEAPDKPVDHTESLKTEIARLLRSLPEKQKQVLVLLYGLEGGVPLSPDDVSRRMLLSIERIRQLREKALYALRTRNNFEMLCTYM